MWLIRHKSLAMAIGIGLLSFMLLFVAVVPIYNNASSLLARIKTKTTELDTLTNKVSLLSKLDPNILQERVVTLDNALPPRKDVLTYLASIDGLSRELGLTFGGISLIPGDLSEATPSAEAAPKKSVKTVAGLQSLETEIKIRGGQESVYSFLRTIEGVLPLMQIKDIKVAVIGADQYSLTLTLGMLWAEPQTGDIKGQVTLFGAEEEKYFNQLSEYRRFEPIVSVPADQTGKSDIFAPFVLGAISEDTATPTASASPSPSPSVIPQQ